MESDCISNFCTKIEIIWLTQVDMEARIPELKKSF